MFLTREIGWPGIAFTLLTAGILAQGLSLGAAGSDSNKEGMTAFVVKNEIMKMQEILRDKGHYRGEIDGAFGLRTRASIRAYQKAENLPVNGQVDTRTADSLGVRPESTWRNSKNAWREVGQGRDRTGGDIKENKPSAGIRRGERRASNARKVVSRPTLTKDIASDSANKPQAENKKHDR